MDMEENSGERFKQSKQSNGNSRNAKHKNLQTAKLLEDLSYHMEILEESTQK